MKTERINLRLEEDDVARLKALAEAEGGISGADVIRRLLNKHFVETFDTDGVLEIDDAIYAVRTTADYIDVIRPRTRGTIVRFHKRDPRDTWYADWGGVQGIHAKKVAKALGLKVRNV